MDIKAEIFANILMFIVEIQQHKQLGAVPAQTSKLSLASSSTASPSSTPIVQPGSQQSSTSWTSLPYLQLTKKAVYDYTLQEHSQREK